MLSMILYDSSPDFSFFFQDVLQRGIFAKRACVSMEVIVRTSGTPTPATVLMAVEARTVNKVTVCVHIVFISQGFSIYPGF